MNQGHAERPPEQSCWLLSLASKLACLCWCVRTSPRLASRCPIWSDVTPVNTTAQWRDDWQSASVVNYTIVTDPTIWQPGIDLPRQSWSLLNCFRTGQGPCRANFHKWGLAKSPTCDVRWQTTTALRSWSWHSQVAGGYSDYSICKMKLIDTLNIVLCAMKWAMFSYANV